MKHCAMNILYSLQRIGGSPAWGNLPQAWESGEHFGLHPDPEYRQPQAEPCPGVAQRAPDRRCRQDGAVCPSLQNRCADGPRVMRTSTVLHRGARPMSALPRTSWPWAPHEKETDPP